MKQQKIKHYSKYLLEGNVIINASTGKTVNVTASTGKYQLINDGGTRSGVSLEKIKELAVAAGAGDKNAKAEKKPKGNNNKAEKTVSKSKVNKELAAKYPKKHQQCFKLHTEGKSVEEIMKLTDTPKNAVIRNIWLYTSGRKDASTI